jgi:hypothetical protein
MGAMRAGMFRAYSRMRERAADNRNHRDDRKRGSRLLKDHLSSSPERRRIA